MKTRSIVVILILILLGGMNLHAQQAAKDKSLSLSWGVGHLKEQDLILSPMIHDGFSPVNTIIKFRSSGKLEHQAYLKFGLYHASAFDSFSYYGDSPDNVERTWPHTNFNVDINYSLGKSVFENNKLKLILGGRSRNRLLPSDNVMAPAVLFGYYISFGIDVWTQLSYSLNDKHTFTANLALPIFSFNGRSPYSWMDDFYFEDTFSHKPLKIVSEYIKGTKLESWKVSQSVDFDINYYYPISEKLDIGTSYLFSLNTNQSPKNLVSIENVLFLNLKLKF